MLLRSTCVTAISSHPCASARDHWGRTPLRVACECGRRSTALLLQSRGVPDFGDTPQIPAGDAAALAMHNLLLIGEFMEVVAAAARTASSTICVPGAAATADSSAGSNIGTVITAAATACPGPVLSRLPGGVRLHRRVGSGLHRSLAGSRAGLRERQSRRHYRHAQVRRLECARPRHPPASTPRPRPPLWLRFGTCSPNSRAPPLPAGDFELELSSIGR